MVQQLGSRHDSFESKVSLWRKDDDAPLRPRDSKGERRRWFTEFPWCLRSWTWAMWGSQSCILIYKTSVFGVHFEQDRPMSTLDPVQKMHVATHWFTMWTLASPNGICFGIVTPSNESHMKTSLSFILCSIATQCPPISTLLDEVSKGLLRKWVRKIIFSRSSPRVWHRSI